MRVEALTHHGLGRLPDGTLVPRVLPGETVEPRGDGTWRVLEPSPDRVAPPCPHFARCGACAVQHLRDERVAEWRAGVVRAAFAAQGIAAEVGPVLTSPPRSRRRARLHGRRTKGGAALGFHARASEEIVDNPRCQVLLPAIMALRPRLLELVRLAAPRGREVGVTVAAAPAGADVLVEGGHALTPALRAEAAAWAAGAGVARLSWDGEPLATLEPPWQPMGRARPTPPPGAFLQATREGEAALVDLVCGALGGAGRVLDLFAGVGTFALPLAGGAEVHAVEGDPALVAALLAGWRAAPGLKRVTAEARDLFRRPLLGPDLRGFGAAVLDPPRQGAEAQVAALAGAGPPRLAYVSCNPATLARDARALGAAGYRMGPVTVVDQFRWSPHVEAFAAFERP